MVIAISEGVTQESHPIQFDFVVTEKSIYTSGSGPEVTEPTPMADHDRDGFIISELNTGKGNYTYIVTWKDKPHLLVSVRPQNIRDYVSARSYEEWNTKKMLTDLRGLDTANMVSYEAVELEQRGKPERKRKRKLSDQIEPNKSLQSINKDLPRQSDSEQPVPLPLEQAVLISPSIKYIDDDLDEDLDQVLDQVLDQSFNQILNPNPALDSSYVVENLAQTEAARFNEISDPENHYNMRIVPSNHTPAKEQLENYNFSKLKGFTPNSPRLEIQHDRSSSDSSPEIISVRQVKKPTPINLGTIKSTTRSVNSDTPNEISNLDMKRLRSEYRKSSAAFDPNLEPASVHNTPEIEDKGTQRQDQSRPTRNLVNHFMSKQTPYKTGENPIEYVSQLENESESEDEVEVEDIKDERWEQDRRGNGIVFYLIKWKGKASYTWEPEENIDSNILAEYTAKKTFQPDKPRRRSSAFHSQLQSTQCTEGLKNKNERNLGFENSWIDSTSKTRKAKQKAMAINMFEPDVPRRKGGGIPGDLGDEDELFQVTTRRRSGTKR